MWRVAAVAVMGIAMAACGGGSTEATGSGGNGGSGGDTGGQGGSGRGGSGGDTGVGGSGGSGQGGSGQGGSGQGGSATALPATGTVQDDCAPNDGPAATFRIGLPAACEDMPAVAMVRFYTYPGGVDDLVAGQSWSYTEGQAGDGVSVLWMPEGPGQAGQPAKSGSLEILAVDGADVEVGYQFVTQEGEKYQGTATLLTCPGGGLCG